MVKQLTAPLLYLALLLCSFSARAEEVTFDEARITLTTTAGVHMMHVQLAQTPKQREEGLMHRVMLHPYAGMLFDFGETRPVTMWMKNTPMRLEMLFINKTGRIVHIQEDTTPYSEAHISSTQPVRYVLELPEGSLDRYGISVGDRIEVP